MSNIPTRILRVLNTCRHGKLICELRREFPAHRPHDLERAAQQLSHAGLVKWTSTGWLITEPGQVAATRGLRLSFQRKPCIKGL